MAQTDYRSNNNSVTVFTCVLVSLLRRWQFIVGFACLVAVGTDIVKTATYVPQYTASVSVAIQKEGGTYQELEIAKNFSKTLSVIFQGNMMGDYVAEKMELDDMPGEISTSLLGETNIMKITATSNTKRNAYLMLKNTMNWYEENREMYFPGYVLTTVEEDWIANGVLNYNNHKENLVSGGMLGLVLSIVVLSVLTYFSDTVKTVSDIQNKLNTRQLGKVPKEHKKKSAKKKTALLITNLKTSFSYIEAIKKLRVKIEASAAKNGYKVIVVTSSVENEGKSSIAANLALSLAQADKKVLLLDADLRKPAVHKIFELKTYGTINQFLQKKGALKDQITYLQKQNLYLLCAEPDEASEELLESKMFKKVIYAAGQTFDYVIVDTPPALHVRDTLKVAEQADATLLVVKQHEATSSMINDTIGRLAMAEANVIGCVFNGSVIDLSKARGGYGYYRYGYGNYGSSKGGK